MASFDIKSLFTNIPLDEAINIATESLFPQNDVSLLGLTSEVFRKLLQFAVKNVLFIFNNQIYQQIDGLNAQHSSIQFTSEIETNSVLNFLDITIAKINNSFETSVFRKKKKKKLSLD